MGNALLKDRRTPRRVRAVSVAEHDRLLTRVFREAKHRVVVASPYVSVLAIRAAGVDATIRDVRARGVQVTVYATLARDKPPTHEGIKVLRDAGANVQIVERLHSKMLIQDTDILVEGSFNWFSAERSRLDRQNLDSSIAYRGPWAAQWIEKSVALLRGLERTEAA